MYTSDDTGPSKGDLMPCDGAIGELLAWAAGSPNRMTVSIESRHDGAWTLNVEEAGIDWSIYLVSYDLEKVAQTALRMIEEEGLGRG